MLLWGERKERVEQLVRAKDLTCHNCGSNDLEAYEAMFPTMGATQLEVTLRCLNCDAGNPVALSPEEYRRCGFDPEEDRQERDETY
jgi:hypothetical protein